MIDPDNTGRYLSIRGPVTEITSEGAVAHGAALAKRYSGSDNYTVPPASPASSTRFAPTASTAWAKIEQLSGHPQVLPLRIATTGRAHRLRAYYSLEATSSIGLW